MNNIDQVAGLATFDTSPSTTVDFASAIDVPGYENDWITDATDPVWRGELIEPATSLTVDFWGRTLPDEAIGFTNYVVRVKTGFDYFELGPRIQEQRAATTDVTQNKHTFTKMIKAGREVPLALPKGPLTIAIRGSFTVDDAMTEIRYDGIEFNSGFSTSGGSEPDPTPTEPTPTCVPTGGDGGRGSYPETPNDPLFGVEATSPTDPRPTQWGPRKIQVPQAWQEPRATGCGIDVAVLDTGVDLAHEDLQCPGKIDIGGRFVPGSDQVGFDWNPDDEVGHGTHVAGIIGACTNNGTGVAGIAPDSTIVPIRVLREPEFCPASTCVLPCTSGVCSDAMGSESALISGLDRARKMGAHVINLSLAYPPDFVNKNLSAINTAIEAAADAGAVIVASANSEAAPSSAFYAGQDKSLPLCAYPAFVEDIICVGATDPRDLKSLFSNFPVKPAGPALVAPGGSGAPFCDRSCGIVGPDFCDTYSENILSTVPLEFDNDACEDVQGYQSSFGTSMAAPHVAGVAALVYDRLGGELSAANAARVIDAITSSVDDLGTPGYDPIFGSGRVNALKAVQAVTAAPDPTPSATPTESASPDPTPTQSASPDPTPSPTPTPDDGDPTYFFHSDPAARCVHFALCTNGVNNVDQFAGLSTFDTSSPKAFEFPATAIDVPGYQNDSSTDATDPAWRGELIQPATSLTVDLWGRTLPEQAIGFVDYIVRAKTDGEYFELLPRIEEERAATTNFSEITHTFTEMTDGDDVVPLALPEGPLTIAIGGTFEVDNAVTEIRYDGYQMNSGFTTSDGPSEPDPTPTDELTPTPTPTESPALDATSVTFTDRSEVAGQHSDETSFEARLTDPDDDPIQGKELTFELIGAESSRSFTATTDAEGVAAVTPTLTEKPDFYQLTVRYVGDDARLGSADTSSLVVDKEDSSIELLVEGNGANRRPIATLIDSDSNAGVPERTIHFYSDGESLGSATTDQSGTATFDPEGKHQGGKHNYEASFDGDDFYHSYPPPDPNPTPSPTPTPTPTPTSTSTPSPTPTPTDEPTVTPTPAPTGDGGRGSYPETPNDSLFGDGSSDLFDFVPTQWGPRRIQAPQAWQEARATGFGIRVAVLDTGVDLQHEDLQCAGKLDVGTGSDVVGNDSDPDDENSHGTHVAGIIGACTNNGKGVAGVAPDATIVPVRVLNAAGSGNDAQLIAGLNKAVELGVHVVNMSLGYLPGKEIITNVSAIDAAIVRARDAGIVLVAAAGNDSFPLCEFPALAEDVICVGATDPRDLKSFYSVFPNKTDPEDTIGPGLVAPGGSGAPFCDTYSENILSTVPLEFDTDGCTDVQGYQNNFGTSMAAPHVAAVAALVYDRLGGDRSAANAAQVIDAITSSVDDLGTPGYDPVFGSGRVNALKAVQAVTVDPNPTPSATPTDAQTPTPDPTSPTGTASAVVTVSLDRTAFPDGLYGAEFKTEGACPSTSDAVRILEGACDESEGSLQSGGTVHTAKLGFSAIRTVEAVGSDVPVLETRLAAVPEQLTRVRVNVKDAGDLRIEISAEPAGGLDPRPIAGSASPGGTVSERAVIWTIADAEPGLHEFTARFAPNAPEGFGGTFVPEVTITRTAESDRLLDHAGVPPPASPIAVTRSSMLELRQHVAPEYGPPTVAAQDFIPARGEFPQVWDASVAFDASGAYDAKASGVVTGSAIGLWKDLGLELLTEHPEIGHGRSYVPFMTSLERPIAGADKVISFTGPALDEEGRNIGFELRVDTATPTNVLSRLGRVPGPLTGTFWDGDSVVIGAVAGMGPIAAMGGFDVGPRNNAGRLTHDWDGSMASSWSGMWANNVPGGEPNALNYNNLEHDALTAALEGAGYQQVPSQPYEAMWLHAASIPFVVEGGDIDNRIEGTPIVGEPVMMNAPPSHTIRGVGVGYASTGPTNFTLKRDSNGSFASITKHAVTLTPVIKPGGYWLENTGEDYLPSWANPVHVTLLSSENGQSYNDWEAESTLVVPPGSQGGYDWIYPDGRHVHHSLSPGMWRISITPEGVTVVQQAVGRAGLIWN